jgi:hypothetical protein
MWNEWWAAAHLHCSLVSCCPLHATRCRACFRSCCRAWRHASMACLLGAPSSPSPSPPMTLIPYGQPLCRAQFFYQPGLVGVRALCWQHAAYGMWSIAPPEGRCPRRGALSAGGLSTPPATCPPPASQGPGQLECAALMFTCDHMGAPLPYSCAMCVGGWVCGCGWRIFFFVIVPWWPWWRWEVGIWWCKCQLPRQQ